MDTVADSVARDLRPLIRGDVEFDLISRRLYATDAGLSQVEPLGVVSPRDAEDVMRLVSYAADRGLSLVPRGMGSGLNGAAVGPGIQVDFTRYMNTILEVAPDASWVRVQPGVVMSSLNHHLLPHGVFFAPDPSSENHCCLGGMIGTNASGARSVAYGATKDHVRALDLVMADGSAYHAQGLELDGPELSAFLAGDTLAARAFAAVLPELRDKEEYIRTNMPRVVKNSCGYRIEAVLDQGDPRAVRRVAKAADKTSRLAHLQRLFVGSEGTLGLVTEATLNLVPLPKQRGIAMAYFPSVFAVGEAVPGILALDPSACEIMDSRFLAMVRKYDSRMDAMLPKQSDTALLIEFEGDDEAEIDERFAVLRNYLGSTAALSLVRAKTAAETEHLWRIRRSAVAWIQRNPGPRQPLPFIEDIAVHPTEVAASIAFLQKVFDREGVEAIMVGHVGDGNIHTRPVLSPRDPKDAAIVRRIYDEVSAYVLSIHGTMAGEHGDGLIHTPRLREMYGDEIYGLFTRIKQAFDPQNTLNPGKKVGPQGASDTLFRDVRYRPDYRTLPQKPILHFPERGYETDIEMCHGCAACKSALVTTMCPVYKATRIEHASPRAKANLLRAIITGALDPESTYGLAAAKTVMDYCIECGMCAVECPSSVNIPKLMLEAKSKYRASHRGKPVELILGRAETVSRLGRAVAPLANRLVNQPVLRRLAEPLVGIDRRRPMAPFARKTFRQIAAGRGLGSTQPAAEAVPAPTVAYFYDLFANYNDPELAHTVERVLAAHGVRVVLPEQRASGIPEMLYGYADAARETAEFNVAAALPYVKEGAVLVSAEPTATFAFKVHYPDYLSSPDCSLVANAARDLGEFLVRRRADHPESVPAAGRLRAARSSTSAAQGGRPLRIAYHQPCHLKAQEIGSPALELLREIPGVEVIDLAAGCCGMAGTFGMKAGTYDFSMQVGQPLFDRVAEVAPDLLASECSTCRMQLAQATGIETVHPVSLLAEAYGV
ncbi:MAG: anaerobic glycerol-3-phosphate dehydrogenase subunit C [Thermoleophilia bacterium]|nr:anaerobic glycerol-3-phosphate dehydrogenase subunit C [Thermoleophilia bacterium]